MQNQDSPYERGSQGAQVMSSEHMDIAIDMGGTFTDAITRRADGSWFVGKSATTPGKLEAGFLAALATVCEDPTEISTLRPSS